MFDPPLIVIFVSAPKTNFIFLSKHNVQRVYMDIDLPSHVHINMQNCTYICKYLSIPRIYWQNSTITIITTVYIAPLFTSCLLVYIYFIIFIYVFVLSFLLLSLFSLSPKDYVMLCYVMYAIFHRHSPLIDCKIVIRDVFSFSLEPN